ncbi:hypothetical protein OKC48_21755 [Methylorubrum extorquens]|uniref:hypothetical protein n=1 Tax=Methylorubrum extorquens TaxID=408 RepID=UPI00223908B9|nr:hypothetical protein [Methylorubrum extorquens]UYW25868.1 hypothetical protein OKC48_21755 [Methylorubrum extorquens]
MADRTPEQQQLADVFLALGVQLPIRVCGMHGRGLAEADGRPRFAGLPGDGPSNERAIALAFAAAVNVATGSPDHEAGPLPVLRPLTADVIRAVENPFDPEHLIAIAKAARNAPRADAAE